MLKINGTYAAYDFVQQILIDQASEVYLGGHAYQISQATADALTAAGFGGGVT